MINSPISSAQIIPPDGLKTLSILPEDIEMNQVMAKGDYFAMNSANMKIQDFHLVGNYSFDGVKNVEIYRAKLLTKDAFWNSV